MPLYKVKVVGKYTAEILVDAEGAFEARCAAARDFADTVEGALLAGENRQSAIGEVTADDAICVTEFA